MVLSIKGTKHEADERRVDNGHVIGNEILISVWNKATRSIVTSGTGGEPNREVDGRSHEAVPESEWLPSGRRLIKR